MLIDDVLRGALGNVLTAARPQRYGQVVQIIGMSIEIAGIPGAIGDGVMLLPDEQEIYAEVVALR